MATSKKTEENKRESSNIDIDHVALIISEFTSTSCSGY